MSLTRAERFDSSSSTPAGNAARTDDEFHTPSGEDEAADCRLRQLTTSSFGTPSQHQINELRKQLVEHQIKMNRMEEQFTSRMDVHSVDIGNLRGDLTTLQSVVMTNIMKMETALKSTQEKLRATKQDMQQLADDHARGYYSKDYLDQLLQEHNHQYMCQVAEMKAHEAEITRLQSQLSMINYQVKEAATSSVQAFDEARKALNFASSYREESSARHQSMAIELNTLRDRADTHEQAICDAHRRNAETMAKQADAEEHHKKDTKKLNERTRLLALRSSETFRSLESNVQSNTQAIAATNANVDNLRQETNKRLGTVEQRVEANSTAIVATNQRVDDVVEDIDTIKNKLGQLQLSVEDGRELALDLGVGLEVLASSLLAINTKDGRSGVMSFCAGKLQTMAKFDGGTSIATSNQIKRVSGLISKLSDTKVNASSIARLIKLNDRLDPEPWMEEAVIEAYIHGYKNKWKIEFTEIGYRVLPELGFAYRTSDWMNNFKKNLVSENKIPKKKKSNDEETIFTMEYKNKKVVEYTPNFITGKLRLLRVVSTGR